MSKELIALYELKRQTFLIGFIQNPECFDDALAYAYDRRIPPIFHQGIEREVYDLDPFSDIYSITPEFMNEVTEYLDKKWHEGSLDEVRFYRLEDKYGRGRRVDLIKILTYARINKLFDDNFWKSVASAAPAEANNIREKFGPKDVFFV